MMRVGDRWELTCPANLAFGDKGRPPSPGRPRCVTRVNENTDLLTRERVQLIIHAIRILDRLIAVNDAYNLYDAHPSQLICNHLNFLENQLRATSMTVSRAGYLSCCYLSYRADLAFSSGLVVIFLQDPTGRHSRIHRGVSGVARERR